MNGHARAQGLSTARGRTGELYGDEGLAVLRVPGDGLVLQLGRRHHVRRREDVLALLVRENPADLKRTAYSATPRDEKPPMLRYPLHAQQGGDGVGLVDFCVFPVPGDAVGAALLRRLVDGLDQDAPVVLVLAV